MTKLCLPFFIPGIAASSRGGLLLGSALAALCAGGLRRGRRKPLSATFLPRHQPARRPGYGWV